MFAITTPAARTSDPRSSHEAADDITMSGQRAFQQKTTANAVRRFPGFTSRELAEKLKLDRYMLARRLSECEAAGEVRRGQMRRCGVSKKLATTWYPPEVAEQLALPMAVNA